MILGPDRVVACPGCDALARHGSLVSGNTFRATMWTDGFIEAPMLPQPPPIVRCHGCGACYLLRVARRLGDLGDPHAPQTWREAPRVEAASSAELYSLLVGDAVGGAGSSGAALDHRDELDIRVLAFRTDNHALREANLGGLGCAAFFLLGAAVPAALLFTLVPLRTSPVVGIGLLGLVVLLAGNAISSLFQTARRYVAASKKREEIARPDGPYRASLRVLFDCLSQDDADQRLLKAEVGRALGHFEAAVRLIDDSPAGVGFLYRERADLIRTLAIAGDPWVRAVPRLQQRPSRGARRGRKGQRSPFCRALG